jgi:hypothetical protein
MRAAACGETADAHKRDKNFVNGIARNHLLMLMMSVSV